jgi:hypothetical protein
MSAKVKEGALRKKPLLTEAEFALLVGHHPVTVGNMRRKGEIDYCQRGRKVWYLNPKHVDAFNQRFEKKAEAA